ncbi:MAG: fluoride efflux transporter CrcB [Acidimicrobiaceae bacterium]|nr:fluoride efflux transporter CrcB [Acidimicrobiaceae bacterium]
MALLGVAIAGAIGAPARLVVDQMVSRWWPGRFPWGTFVVNASGALVLGVVTGWALYHGLGALPKTVLGTGLLGAYTTFSTFSFETVRLVEEGENRAALANVGGSLIVGLLAAAAGLGLMAAL